MIWIKANGPGIGDALFLTSLAHEIKKQTNNQVSCVAGHKELFENNPDISAVTDNHEAISFPELHEQHKIKEHNVQFMCRKLGLTPPSWPNIRQYIYLKPEEKLNINYQYVTIHGTTSPWTENRIWYGFPDLIRLIKKNTSLITVQVAGPSEPKLNCDHLIQSSLRTTAAWIEKAKCHICCVSGTMHIASGVGTKSIVIYGGRERSKITGYFNNINLETHCGCAPCWLVPPCPYGTMFNDKFHKPCLDIISPEQVFEELRKII